MIELNLKTENEEQEMIKQYLQENASETLAVKINNGVKIVKDNKTFINKKDLNGFWNYATEEARKLASKGARGKAVKDETVYGWAIHYFEEESIEGKLFNEDGTEYKPAKPKPIPKIETKPQPKKPENKQATLFDLFSVDNEESTETEENEEAFEEIEKEYEEEQKVEESVKPENIEIVETKTEKVVVDKDTGEVLSKEQIEQSFDKETMFILYNLFDGKMDMR